MPLANTAIVTADDLAGLVDVDPAVVNATLVETWLNAVSARLDDAVGPVIVREVAERHQGGRACVLLRRPPVAEVVTVTEAGVPVPEGGWRLDADEGILWRRDRLRWEGEVEVTYRAGRFEARAEVEDRYRAAAALMFAAVYRRELSGASPTWGDDGVVRRTGATFVMPYAVLDLLADELRGDAGVHADA